MARNAKSRRAGLTLRGVAASPGIAVGPVRWLDDLNPSVEQRELPADRVESEAERFREALLRARDELAALRGATAKDLGEDEARIFDVQLQVLEDPMVIDRTVESIRAERLNAEYLFARHVHDVADRLAAVAHAYFADRAVDLHDVKRRVLRHLAGAPAEGMRRSGILVGREIAPSDAVHLDPGRVLGFATELGGPTSHAAIMARARGIPAVVAVKGLSGSCRDGDTIAVDGVAGRIHLNPSPALLEDLKARRRAYAQQERRRGRLVGLPADTLDGAAVRLAANMELPEELEYILSRGGRGIGLFRTEFFFMQGRRAPAEEDQVRVYRRIVESMPDDEVVVRVLDVGGDKFADYLGIPKERNPFLGMRGVRYLLAHPEVLRTQLRAILRAGAGGRLKILIPMVSGVEELEAVRRIVREEAAVLADRRVAHEHAPAVGVMVEIPSAVLMADELAARADFLSIGSNDLIQYTLAVERDHEVLHRLYQPLHPAILRSILTVAEAGRRHQKPVSVCGEMAGDPAAIPVLLGLGIERLSVSPYLLPEVKQAIRALRREECARLAKRAVAASTAGEVERMLRTALGREYGKRRGPGSDDRTTNRSRAKGDLLAREKNS